MMGWPVAQTDRGRALWLFAAALLGLQAGACSGVPSTFHSHGSGRVELTMPSGWNDQLFERFESGNNAKTRVAVLEIRNKSGNPEARLQGLADMLVTELMSTGRLEPVERAKYEEAEREIQRFESRNLAGGLAGQGPAKSRSAQRLGKMLGADVLINGSISKAECDLDDLFAYKQHDCRVELEVTATDTSAGELIFAERAVGSFQAKLFMTAEGTVIAGKEKLESGLPNAARDAARKIAQTIATSIPLLAKVVSVRDTTVYLDIKQGRGVKRGERFIVFRKGERIRHPDTGTHLGWEKEVLAALEVTSQESDMCVGRVLKLRDPSRPIRTGDLVVSAQ